VAQRPGLSVSPNVHGRPGAGGRVARPALPGDRNGIAGGDNRNRIGAGGDRSGISNRSLGGNEVNIANRNVNIANDNYSPSYTWHPGFYHGYWNGNWGGGWGGGWGGPFGYGGYGYDGFGYGYGGLFGGGYWGRPFGWGLGAWGLGALLYNSGYLGYYNPYWGNGFGAGYIGDYSQPIVVDYSAPAVVAETANQADDILTAAIAAFRQGDYDAALDIAAKGIAQYPDDAVLHEFRALALFARGDYQQAAAVLHSVLAVGPGWDWTTMARLYPDLSVYTDQLRALEDFIRQNPQDAAARFLIAYHYTTAGHVDAAARQLAQVSELIPNDRVAAELLRMLKPPANAPTSAAEVSAVRPQSPAVTPQPPVDEAENAIPSGPAVDPQSVVGSWKASRKDGAQFDLTLTNEHQFTWRFAAPKQKATELKGKFTIDHNVLSLQQPEGGALVGQVVFDGDNKFNFKMVGGPAEDPGLDFTR
jgi:tetratricopeptide (TPR) repeat protein